jgi:Putative prokaryotic signal transducing protein
MSTVDPEAEQIRLAGTYAAMSDAELEKLAQTRATLTDVGRAALASEMDRRGRPIPDEDGVDEVEFRELVILRQFTGLPEALLAKGSLESAGIECFLADDNYVRMDWFISNAIGGVKLRLKPEDVEAANEILDQPIPENFDLESGETVVQPRCPVCQSLDVTFQELNQPVAFASAALRLPIPLHRAAWRCHACKHEWADEGTQP